MQVVVVRHCRVCRGHLDGTIWMLDAACVLGRSGLAHAREHVIGPSARRVTVRGALCTNELAKPTQDAMASAERRHGALEDDVCVCTSPRY